MQKYDDVMSDVLEVEYKINAAVCILEILEDAYDENEDSKAKALTTFMLGYLKGAAQDASQIALGIDEWTIKENSEKE